MGGWEFNQGGTWTSPDQIPVFLTSFKPCSSPWYGRLIMSGWWLWTFPFCFPAECRTNVSANTIYGLLTFTDCEIELLQSCQGANFTILSAYSNVHKKDIIGKSSSHRKQWCKFHLHISFLSQVTIIGVNNAKPIDTNSNKWWLGPTICMLCTKGGWRLDGDSWINNIAFIDDMTK